MDAYIRKDQQDQQNDQNDHLFFLFLHYFFLLTAQITTPIIISTTGIKILAASPPIIVEIEVIVIVLIL